MRSHEGIYHAKPGWRTLNTGIITALLLVAGLFGGCARRYDMQLTRGDVLTNVRKPQLHKDGGYYTFIDGKGRTNAIPASRVLEIDPHQTPKLNAQ